MHCAIFRSGILPLGSTSRSAGLQKQEAIRERASRCCSTISVSRRSDRARSAMCAIGRSIDLASRQNRTLITARYFCSSSRSRRYKRAFPAARFCALREKKSKRPKFEEGQRDRRGGENRGWRAGNSERKRRKRRPGEVNYSQWPNRGC